MGIFLTLVAGMRGGQHSGCPYTPHTSTCPYVCMPPVCVYTSICPLYICMFPYTICSPYVMGTWGASVHPNDMGSFMGHQYICQAFLCQCIHCLSVHKSYQLLPIIVGVFLTGLDASGCMLCFVLLFLSLECFYYVSSFYYHGYDYYSSGDCCVLWYVITPQHLP